MNYEAKQAAIAAQAAILVALNPKLLQVIARWPDMASVDEVAA